LWFRYVKKMCVLEEAKQALHLRRLKRFGVDQRLHVDEELAHQVKGKGEVGTGPHGMKRDEQLCRA
jgi:polysaccharide pyruvyl transferase WcaK-like protein